MTLKKVPSNNLDISIALSAVPSGEESSTIINPKFSSSRFNLLIIIPIFST